jgi:hypothetical protein
MANREIGAVYPYLPHDSSGFLQLTTRIKQEFVKANPGVEPIAVSRDLDPTVILELRQFAFISIGLLHRNGF